jgi:hypothetical protein
MQYARLGNTGSIKKFSYGMVKCDGSWYSPQRRRGHRGYAEA